MPIERGRPGPGLLAHVPISKYADHLPRPAPSPERDLCASRRRIGALDSRQLVGRAAALLEPLVEALRQAVMPSPVLYGDDTPLPVLAPGLGKTKTGALGLRARRAAPGPASARQHAYFYSPDRKGERPQEHLADLKGVLHADGYAGFNALFEGNAIAEAACWAHVRCKFFEVHTDSASPIAQEALDRIGALYGIEADIRDRPPDDWRRARREKARPRLAELKAWLDATRPKLSAKTALAAATRYALARLSALERYLDDGRLEIDTDELRSIPLRRQTNVVLRPSPWASGMSFS